MKYPVIQADDISLSLVVRRDFAERHELEIIAEDEERPVKNLAASNGNLAIISDADLLAECTRRGFSVAG